MFRSMSAALCGCLLSAAMMAAGQAQAPAQGQAPQRRGPSPEALAAAGSRPAPSKAEYERWKTELSNWGRWGKDDQLGAINLITPAKRKQAAGLVKDGITVSLAGDVNTERSADNFSPYEHVMTSAGPTGAGDKLAVSFHGYAHTHIDAFAHRFFDGKMWNGVSHEEVTEKEGAKKNSIYNLHNGIVTRGVLIDIPRLKGVPYLEPGTRIFVEDIEAWEKQAGVKVSAGDAVFIRTGRWARRAKLGAWNAAIENAGLDPSVIPWLKKRDVAILGGEGAQDATPPPTGSELGGLALHDFALIMLGVHLMDDTNLEAVSQVAAQRKRWEFLLMAGPLPVTNGTGSPLNPIAVF
ncbi:MAG: cyclase family protein [Vicinamibacterales bacterium]